MSCVWYRKLGKYLFVVPLRTTVCTSCRVDVEYQICLDPSRFGDVGVIGPDHIRLGHRTTLLLREREAVRQLHVDARMRSTRKHAADVLQQASSFRQSRGRRLQLLTVRSSGYSINSISDDLRVSQRFWFVSWQKTSVHFKAFYIDMPPKIHILSVLSIPERIGYKRLVCFVWDELNWMS